MSGKINKNVVRLGVSIVIALAGIAGIGAAANASTAPAGSATAASSQAATGPYLCCNPWG